MAPRQPIERATGLLAVAILLVPWAALAQQPANGRYGMGWGPALQQSKVWNWRDGGGRDRRMLSNHLREAAMLRVRAVVLAAVLIVMAPLGARAADLVVWWEKGFYPEEDEAVREIIAAFEQKTGKQVELVLHPQAELPDKIEAALEAGQPPDFAFGIAA